METVFVDVIIPLAVPNLFTYRVQREWADQVQVGARVVVQFGRNKLYSAIVRKRHHQPPAHYEAKYIHNILDDHPIVTEEQFKLWEWIASYYMCTIGEVMAAALPNGLKLSSETRIVLNENHDVQYEMLTDREYLIAEALEVNNVLTLKEISEILDLKEVHPIVKGLLAKGVIFLEEELKTRYKPKLVSFVALKEAYQSEAALNDLFNELGNAKKQLAILMKYVELSQFFSGQPQPVKKVVLQKAAGASASSMNGLVEKGIFELIELEEGRLPEGDEVNENATLSEEQTRAHNEINAAFEQHDVVLLHGVTGSGKTEIYIQLMHEALARGERVLYLLPEIALTTQIITRLQKFFGDRVGVYHSKFNENERVEVWNNLIENKRFEIILGARSALFLPHNNLGLIIVDEEHETTFKQFEPSPRYHARDAAIVLAGIHQAKVLLGSATPSVESYYNANQGKYGFVALTKRYGGIHLPEVFVADLKEDSRKKKMRNHFSELLFLAMDEALENKEQIILFQNRRGFSPFIQCETCGWVPYCTRCDVAMNYHKYLHRLKCHYCGYERNMPKTCDACGANTVKLKGFGTEKIEEDVELLFPKAKVARMDLDTTRSKNAYQNIINDFQDRNIDILVGTQMVTKGLDFDNVSLVGILNADQMLNFQDFRAFERSFQLMAQVSGRAGRRKTRGKVIIQSFQPYHPIIRQVIDNNYEGMYHGQVLERRNFKYPPFYRLIEFSVRHRDKEVVNEAATYLGNELRNVFKERVLGPEFPAIARIRNKYHKNLMLKFERTASIAKVKSIIQQIMLDFEQHPTFKKVHTVIDVDPV
ncbi:MAG: primosomal protein N' [Crocinitomicaceae bacterium]|nr:primosomal protein N' [Crocinitomicaceae bacterium]